MSEATRPDAVGKMIDGVFHFDLLHWMTFIDRPDVVIGVTHCTDAIDTIERTPCVAVGHFWATNTFSRVSWSPCDE